MTTPAQRPYSPIDHPGFCQNARITNSLDRTIFFRATRQSTQHGRAGPAGRTSWHVALWRQLGRPTGDRAARAMIILPAALRASSIVIDCLFTVGEYVHLLFVFLNKGNAGIDYITSRVIIVLCTLRPL